MHRKILIMGLPGAGKTTLATALTPRLSAVHLNADEFRHHANRDLGSPRPIASNTRGAWVGYAIRW